MEGVLFFSLQIIAIIALLKEYYSAYFDMKKVWFHSALGLLLFAFTVSSVSFIFFSSEAKGTARAKLVSETQTRTVQVCAGTGDDRTCHTEERVVEIGTESESSSSASGSSGASSDDSGTEIVQSYPGTEESSSSSTQTQQAQEETVLQEEEVVEEEVVEETVVEDDSLTDKIKEKVKEKVCNGNGKSKWCNGDATVGEDPDQNYAPTFVTDPVVSSDYQGLEGFYDGIIDHLIAGGQTSLHVHGMIEDLNGQMDIATIDASLYLEGEKRGCIKHPLKCYRHEPCTIEYSQDTDRIRYDCELSLEYWAKSTDDFSDPEDRPKSWYLAVTAQDVGGEQAINTQRNFEVASVTGVEISQSFSFGAFSIGQKTDASNNYEQVVVQKGNVVQDLVIVMADEEFACSKSEKGIPRENVQWSLVDVGYDHIESHPLTVELTEVDLGLGTQEDAALGAPETLLYWNIHVPDGVKGICKGTVEVYAKNAYLP
jgi:hypothetical protein